MNSLHADQLKDRLTNALEAQVKVVDESHLHVGHEGAKSGGKHFRVEVTSDQFKGLNTIQKHRLVYDAVADWMNKEIHALAIMANTPS